MKTDRRDLESANETATSRTRKAEGAKVDMGVTKQGINGRQREEKRNGRPSCLSERGSATEEAGRMTPKKATTKRSDIQGKSPRRESESATRSEEGQEATPEKGSRKHSDRLLKEVIAEKEAWKDRYGKLKTLFEELRDQKIKENEEISSLFREYQQNFAAEVQGELDNVRSQTHALHKQIGQLEGELLIAQQEAEAATSESKRLSSLVDVSSNAVQSVQVQAQGSLQKERDQALERIVQLESEFNRQSREWGQERDVLQASVREEEKKVQELKCELRDTMKELRSMKTQCEESKFTCDRTRQYYDELLAQMKSQLSVQESEAAVAKEELLQQLRDFLDQSMMADVHIGRMNCAGG